MTSFPTKTQVINQPLTKRSNPAVSPQILPRPQIPPNTPAENFTELEEQFADYFFQLVILYHFSFFISFNNISSNLFSNEPPHSVLH